MSVERDIRDLIRQIAGERQPVLFTATVVSVQGSSCTVRYQGVTLSDVRLTAMDDAATITITPAVGSTVVVADLSSGSKRSLCVVQYGKIDSITINGGALGGLVIGSRLADWMNTVAQDLQALKTLLSTTPVAGNGAPLGAVFNPQTSTVSTNDIENSKVKHG